MRHMKKLTAFILSALMVVAMAIPAFASDVNLEPTITIKDDRTGAQYKAFQIFKGTVSNNGQVLSNVEWGKDVDSDTVIQALAADADVGHHFTNCKTAVDVIEAINTAGQPQRIANIIYNTKTGIGTPLNTVEGGYSAVVPGAGYYLIADETDEKGKVIAQILGDVSMNPKSNGVPTLDKKVSDSNLSQGSSVALEPGMSYKELIGMTWEDSADHVIGDKVPYQLNATMPSDICDYSNYKMVITDTLSAGLTVEPASIRVFYGEGVSNATEAILVTKEQYDQMAASAKSPNNKNLPEGTAVPVGVFYYTLTETDTGSVLTIGSDNIQPFVHNGEHVKVYYNATLNKKAAIGYEGNPNTAKMTYSNDPLWTGIPDAGSTEVPEEPTDDTPDDKVIVFTYKLVLNKVDKEGNPLAGAEFALTKYDSASKTWNSVTLVKSNGNVFTATGLDDGTYKLVETTVPDGYNKLEDTEFTITAEHQAISDDPQLTSIGTTLTHTISDDGTINSNVVNHKGLELPSTGGMGTTIFYVLGGIMVVGAGVLLITKKRMGAE